VQGLCQHHYKAQQEGTQGAKRPMVERCPNRDKTLIPCACGCGGMLEATDGCNRPRRFLHGHNRSGLRKPSPLRGRPLTPEHSQKIAARLKAIGHLPGIPLTPEAAARQHLPHTPERKAHMSHLMRGRKLHSDAFKTKMRAKRLLEVFPRKDSTIEVALQQALTAHGIVFETHKPLFGQPDIFIAPTLCIFADGDYWHNLPKVKARDPLVNTHLHEHGYIVLRFPEYVIRKNLDSCIQAIIVAMEDMD